MPRYAEQIIGVVVCVALALLMRVARQTRPTATSDGDLVFGYSPPCRAFGAIGVPIGMAAMLLAHPPRTADDAREPAIACLLLAAIGLPLWWEMSRFRLVVTPRGLGCRSPWRGERFLPWDEIEEVGFSSVNQWFIVRARGDRTFCVHTLVGGVAEFLAECEERLGITALAGAKLGYVRVGRPWPGP